MTGSKETSIMNILLTVLVLILSGSGVCLSQTFQIGNEYFFKKDIDPTMIDMICRNENGKMKKTIKKSNEWIDNNVQSLFEYRGIVKDKKNNEYYEFQQKTLQNKDLKFLPYDINAEYFFPLRDKNGNSIDYQKYAVNFTEYKAVFVSKTERYHNYIDLKKAKIETSTFPSYELLFGRFCKIDSWSNLYLSENQEICYRLNRSNIVTITDNNFSWIVPNKTINDLNEAKGRVNRVKNFLNTEYIDLAKSKKTINSSKLVGERFCFVEFKDIVADDNWNAQIQLLVDGHIINMTVDELEESAVSTNIVLKYIAFSNYVESVRSKSKFIDVRVNDEIRNASLNSNNLPISQFNYVPMSILRAEIDDKYNTFVVVSINAKEYRVPATDFEKYAKTQQEVDIIEGNTPFFEKNLRDHIFYFNSNLVDYYQNSKGDELFEGVIMSSSYPGIKISAYYQFSDSEKGVYVTHGYAELDTTNVNNRFEYERRLKEYTRNLGMASTYNNSIPFTYKVSGNNIEISVKVDNEITKLRKQPISMRRARAWYKGPIYLEFVNYRNYVRDHGEIRTRIDNKPLTETEWRNEVFDMTGHDPVALMLTDNTPSSKRTKRWPYPKEDDADVIIKKNIMFNSETNALHDGYLIYKKQQTNE